MNAKMKKAAIVSIIIVMLLILICSACGQTKTYHVVSSRVITLLGDELSGPQVTNASLELESANLAEGSKLTFAYFGKSYSGSIGTIESDKNKYVFWWDDDAEKALMSGCVGGYTEIKKDRKTIIMRFYCNVDFGDSSAWVIEEMKFQ